MRAAGPGDVPAIAAFLDQRVETSMFPLANLLGHGLGRDRPRQMRFWVAGVPLTGVIGLSGAGMVLPQIDPSQADAAARAMAGLPVAGLAGERPLTALSGGMESMIATVPTSYVSV